MIGRWVDGYMVDGYVYVYIWVDAYSIDKDNNN